MPKARGHDRREVDIRQSPVRPVASSRRARRTALTTIVLVSLAAGACGRASVAQPTSKAASPAVTSIRSASRGMTRADNFTFAATTSTHGSTTTIVGQFRQPDLDHLIVSTAGGTATEILLVGTKAFVRLTDGTWQTGPATPTGSSDPRRAFGALQHATDVKVLARSAGNARYGFTLSGAPAKTIVQAAKTGSAVSLTGTVVVSNNTVTDLAFNDPAQMFTAEIAYSAIGTTPAFPLPPGI
jgi:hypothetical protein